jgi:hypothetical protein
MPGTVYFLIQGQFGNNLFQYFAAELMKKIYGFEEVKPTFHINLEFNTVIDDEKAKVIFDAYLQGTPIPIDTRKDMLLMGFFQRSEIFKAERDYLRSLFCAENMSHISNRIQIGNIVKYQTKHTIQPTQQDLTLHLRCGDFWDHVKNRSQIFDPVQIKEIVKSIPHDKLYIVADKSNFDWEKTYYDQFEELQPIWIRGNLGDDFDFLMKSSKLITSASTLSWMAAFLGNADEVHIPYNTYYGGVEGNGQSLAEYNETCKVYYNVGYWSPSS